MRNATLRQLKVFESVARNLSFTRAAAELHLTQPAVSTQVKLLEQHAGLPLFEQLGKKVFLTAAGAEMVHHGRAIIRQFGDADEAMQRHRGLSGGRLAVTVISAGDYFFPHLLAVFQRRHPQVVTDLAVVNREELLRRIADNRTDLGVTVRRPESSDLVAEPFAPHPYVVVAPPSHPLARRRRVPVSRLSGERFVVREQGSGTRSAMMRAFGSRMPRLDLTMEIASNEMVKQAVLAGMGLTFLSAYAIALELRVGSLVVVDVQGFPVMETWHVVHRREKRLSPAASAFAAFLVEEGKALIRDATRFRAPREGRRRAQ